MPELAVFLAAPRPDRAPGMNTTAPPPLPHRSVAPSTSGWRIWGGRILKAVAFALTAYFTWRFLSHGSLDWSELALRLRQAKLGYLLLGLAMLLGRWNLWDWRFRRGTYVAAGKASGPVLGFFILLSSAALNLITPTARILGGLIRARYFARAERRPFGIFFGVVLWDQVAYHGVMALCTWITFIGTAFYLGRMGWGLGASGALVAVLGLLAVWSRRFTRFGDNPLIRLLARRAEVAEGGAQRIYSHGHEAAGVFVRLLADRKLAVASVILGIPYFVVNAGGLWAMFLALGDPVNPFVVLAVVSLGTAVGTLSGTPGGIGATEVAMLASFRAFGIDPVAATAGTLLYRGLHYGSILLLGLPALLVFELRARDQPTVREEDLAA